MGRYRTKTFGLPASSLLSANDVTNVAGSLHYEHEVQTAYAQIKSKRPPTSSTAICIRAKSKTLRQIKRETTESLLEVHNEDGSEASQEQPAYGKSNGDSPPDPVPP